MFWIVIRNFMKRYFSGLLAAVAAFAAGCTDVDDSLGQDMIPSGQQMTIDMGTVGAPFDGFIQVNDSVPASGEGVIFLGSMEDAVFGRARAAAMTDCFNRIPAFADITPAIAGGLGFPKGLRKPHKR